MSKMYKISTHNLYNILRKKSVKPIDKKPCQWYTKHVNKRGTKRAGRVAARRQVSGTQTESRRVP
nr:MAG TPA: hypothetical protein [Caudoviricetes sp.]